MRVCLLAYRYYESNAHMQQFARALADRGDVVDVVGVRRPGAARFEVVDGVNVWRLAERTAGFGNPLTYVPRLLWFIFRAGVFLALHHLRERYDLIHVQSVPDLLVSSALIPKLLGASVILDIRDLTPELLASKLMLLEGAPAVALLRRVERRCAAFADHVIVANPIWHKRLISRSVPAEKCDMIWYAPDPRVFYPRRESPRNGRFVMMYPGTLSPHQGVDVAIRALPRIAAEIPEAVLHVYGEGPGKANLVALVQQLGLGERVRFFDFLPVEQIAVRMADCDLAIVPKRVSDRFGNEAASTKIPEFMALGVPVVASRTAIESLFFDDSELRYFRSEDEQDLARAVVSVYRDAALRQSLAGNGMRCAGEKTQTLRNEYLALVDRLAARRGQRAEQPPALTPGARIYYAARPLIPRRAQVLGRRQLARRTAQRSRDCWPIREAAGLPPPAWTGWPEGKRFALVLTHDVEQGPALSKCERLADIEQQRDFSSTFGFVPLRYRTPKSLRRMLADRGFEIMVHDLYHDGKLFRDRKTFTERRPRIDDALREWNTRGFTTGSMHHNLPWVAELNIDCAVSTYDVDPFEPQACGFGRIFPYWVESPKLQRGFVELPYTLPQDFTLFILLREQTNSIWRKKLDWIAEKGGMALIKTHPDYMAFHPGDKRADTYPAELYTDFLDYINSRYAGQFWLAHPSEVARYWRSLCPVDLESSNSFDAPATLCASCRQAHAEGWLSHYPREASYALPD